jgi:hypothetical protein
MDNLAQRGGNFALSSAALTATGAETYFDTTVTLSTVFDGKFGTPLTAVTNGVTPTTDGNTGEAITLVANQARAVVWAVNSSGGSDVTNIRVFAGPVVSQSGGAYVNALPQLPAIPDAYCPFAVQYLEAASTAVGTVTFGTTNWNATGFTNTIHNVHKLPSRPVNV